MRNPSDYPIIVQRDRTVMLETDHPLAAQARAAIAPFSELLKSPEHLHTYRITPLSLWNAAASGVSEAAIVEALRSYSKFDVPLKLLDELTDEYRRYGALRLEREDGQYRLKAKDPALLAELVSYASIKEKVDGLPDRWTAAVRTEERGRIKQELTRLGYPVEDLCGYQQGERLQVRLRECSRSGSAFALRDYQRQAAESYYSGGGTRGGSGVVVLPCGAGKTVVGLGVMALLNCATLILTPNVTSVKQWKRELMDKTELQEWEIGEYAGASKQVRPVTIATYQVLTYRRKQTDPFTHLRLFHEREWGLIIYDEVHLLPAPVFRATADIQAARRLGLTATLVREDGREGDVFSLVGPKKYDLGWKALESKGYIAVTYCTEVRVPLEEQARISYEQASARQRHRIAGENKAKIGVLRKLLDQHKGKQVLIIGQYLSQLKKVAEELQAPVITGETPYETRESIYEKYRKKAIDKLVVSKVANFAVDLPDASVAIQLSGSFGSRQEEAQRIGRILRPKAESNEARFYSLVSEDTKEVEFAMNRQLFMVEQGYRYEVLEAEEVVH